MGLNFICCSDELTEGEKKKKKLSKGSRRALRSRGSWSAAGVQRRIHKRFRLAPSAGSRCLAVLSDLGLIYLIAAQRRRVGPLFFGDPLIHTDSLPDPFISPFLWLFHRGFESDVEGILLYSDQKCKRTDGYTKSDG